MSTNRIQISEYLLPLAQFSKLGKVHSVFEHSFNLEFAGKLMNIANYHEYLSSYGIFLTKELFDTVQPFAALGNVVKLAGETLTFYSRGGVKHLDLTDAEPVSLQIKPIPYRRAQLLQLKELLEKEKLGERIGIEQNDTFQQIAAELATAPQPRWEAIGKFLVGRGQGLTPSGDDMLVSYLFVLKMFQDPRAAPLSAMLAQHEDTTTDISKAYIQAISAGYVNSLIYDFYQDLKNQAPLQKIHLDIEKIEAIGHTSGKDMCYGILLAISSMIHLRKGE